MLELLQREFQARFGRAPELGVRAPGRVNLIGEHTDYNEGLVLPCAIDLETLVLAARRSDRRVRVFSVELASEGEFSLDALERSRDWLDYVKGPAFALAERGLAIPGLDLGVASRVPRESGLSSSAALGVAITLAFVRAGELDLALRDCALLAHRAESEFVGVGCGIMDQFASALGRRDHLLRIDCRIQQVTHIPLAGGAARARMLIAQSGVTRALAKGRYAERVAECRAALKEARSAGIAPPAARSLRSLGPAALPALERALDARLFRRARHVITENERVERMVEAVGRGDLAAAGAILREGMVSLREDFEVSTPELDRLCALADAHPGSFGSRLSGAGFGGCTLHLVARESAADVAEALCAGFEAEFGRRPEILETCAAEGAGDLVLRPRRRGLLARLLGR